MTGTDRTPVEDLNSLAVDVEPHDFDFGTGYPEEWEYWEADRCGECGHVKTTVLGEERCAECGEGWLHSEGPMMNTLWPLPDGFSDVDGGARALLMVPLCIVDTDPQGRTGRGYGLALTGGGMDLSWEIAEAYMLLGYLPPARLRLPKMAGMKATDRNRWIVDGLKRSQEIRQARTEGNLQDVESVRDWLESES